MTGTSQETLLRNPRPLIRSISENTTKWCLEAHSFDTLAPFKETELFLDLPGTDFNSTAAFPK
jgi:hypothetical protein